jgi:hypothetical protein
VFGIFSELIVSIWANDERSKYKNLGRPTIRSGIADRGSTLDFTLVDRTTGLAYVSEMKCEIEYQNFKFFVLDGVDKIAHHRKPAFDAFLTAAKSPDAQDAYVAKSKIECSGAVLIWGAITSVGREEVIAATGLHDVLSIEDICDELARWQNAEYLEFLQTRRDWCDRLFDGLESRSR